MICGRFNHRVYVAYSIVYSIGTLLSMQISFVGFMPVQTSEHMMVNTQKHTYFQQIFQKATYFEANDHFSVSSCFFPIRYVL
jgi:hypothetical protein